MISLSTRTRLLPNSLRFVRGSQFLARDRLDVNPTTLTGPHHSRETPRVQAIGLPFHGLKAGPNRAASLALAAAGGWAKVDR
jgi:hypothetical protein